MEYENRQHINIVSLFTRRVWRYRKGNQNPYNTAVVICLCLLTRAWMFVSTDRHFYFLLTDRYLDACGYWREIECFICTWICMLVFTNKDLNALFLYVFGCLCLQTRTWMLYLYMYLEVCGYWQGFQFFIFTGIWMLMFTNREFDALFFMDLDASAYKQGLWCFIFTWI